MHICMRKGDVTRATHHQHMCIIHMAKFCPNIVHIYSRINVLHILRVSNKIFQMNDCFHIQCVTNSPEGIFDVSRIIQINIFLKLSLDASFRNKKNWFELYRQHCMANTKKSTSACTETFSLDVNTSNVSTVLCL